MIRSDRPDGAAYRHIAGAVYRSGLSTRAFDGLCGASSSSCCLSRNLFPLCD